MADGGRLSADAASILILRSIENTLGNGCVLHPPDPPSCLTRKKRPPMLQIPAVVQGKPLAPDSRSPQSIAAAAAGVSAAGPGWGVFSRKGRRKNNLEDFYTALPRPEAHPRCKGFFGVYDGHGGRSAGKYVAAKLHENVLEMLGQCHGADIVDSGGVAKEEAIRAGFLKTDQEFLEKKLGSGSCCVTAVIEEEGLLAVSNVGDCRAVLSRGGFAEGLTNDHKGSREDEKARVEAEGGLMVCKQGIWRVQGDLAITRSMGDAHLKDCGVSAEPDTVVLPVTPEMDFLILASDGLWDKVNNQEAVEIVALYTKQGERSKKRKREAKTEVDTGSKENQTRACRNSNTDIKEEQCADDQKPNSSASFSNLGIVNHGHPDDEKGGCITSNRMEVGKEDKQHGADHNESSLAKTGEITEDGDKQNGDVGSLSGGTAEMGEIERENEPIPSQEDANSDKPSVSQSTSSSLEMGEKPSSSSPSNTTTEVQQPEGYGQQQGCDQNTSSQATIEKIMKGENCGDKNTNSCCPCDSNMSQIPGEHEAVQSQVPTRDYNPSGKESADTKGKNSSENHCQHVDENGSPPPKEMKLATETAKVQDPNGDQQLSGTESSGSSSDISGKMTIENHLYPDENASPPPPKKMKLATGVADGGVTPSRDGERHRRCGTPTPTPKHRSVWAAAAEKLAGVAVKKGSNDDVTVMIIDLKHYQ